MSIQIIAYELADPQHNAAPLAAAIMRLGARWARPLNSLWYVEFDGACSDIEAALAPLLATDDGLLVQQAAGEAVVANTMLRWTPSRFNEAGTDVPFAIGAQIIEWSTGRTRQPAATTAIASRSPPRQNAIRNTNCAA